MRKKSNKSSMSIQNSIILVFFIISVLLSGCGIKGPLTQKPAAEQIKNQKNDIKAEQNQTSPTQQP